MLDIGVNDSRRRTADLPLFTLRCRTTGTVMRAPYFHNGSAATADLVAFLSTV